MESSALKLSPETIDKVLLFQQSEITEYLIYEKLSRVVQNPHNQEILRKISADELGHYQFWKTLTHRDVAPDRFKVMLFVIISRIFGLTFGLKLMESGEGTAQISYDEITAQIPNAQNIRKDEEGHENQILNMIDEEKLQYISSAVLGLNDALVELTGALAGFTLALQNTRLIAMVGLITGIAAAFSMSTSEYLSTKSEENSKDPLKAALYTGAAYLGTVLLLIFPFLIMDHAVFSLTWCILNAVAIIALFTFYISVAKGLSFKKRFIEMTAISLGVATLTFGIGWVIKTCFHIEA
jgi:VIT1/CCC1 family predicted Fe2+/Mn2+ transporter